jgi:hypothetical protein
MDLNFLSFFFLSSCFFAFSAKMSVRKSTMPKMEEHGAVSKIRKRVGCQQLTPVIPATWESKMGRIVAKASLCKVSETPSQ